MDSRNVSNCSKCMDWKDPKLTHKLQEDGLIAPPIKQGHCCSPNGSYSRKITESMFSCASFRPKMLNG